MQHSNRNSEFRPIVGPLSLYAISLIYDIAHSISRLQSVVTTSSLNGAIRVAAYVGSSNGFRIGGAVTTWQNVLECHSDSDHAGKIVL